MRLPRALPFFFLPFLLFCLALRPEPVQPKEPAGNSPSGRTNFTGKYLTRILERGKIIIGIQKDYHPFHIQNPVRGYPGIDAEVARRLARALGVKLELRFLPLHDLLKAVSSAKIDLSLGGISSSLRRSRLAHFTPPYLITTPAGLLARSALPPESGSVNFPRRDYKSLSDIRTLGKLALGVKKGTTNERLLRSRPEFRKHSIVTFANRTQLVAALKSGRVDVLVADGIYIKSLLLKNSDLQEKFLSLTQTYSEEHICIALPRGDAEYWNYMNFFVREIRRSGFMAGLRSKYLESGAWIKNR